MAEPTDKNKMMSSALEVPGMPPAASTSTAALSPAAQGAGKLPQGGGGGAGGGGIVHDDATQGNGGVNTLDSVDFASIIGGPLIAAVNASGQAAMATAEYISAVGFESDGQTLRTVTFNYTTLQVDTGDGQSTQQSASITVPLITILPIPYLRVDSVNIDFKAQIDSINSVTNVNTFGITTSVSGGTSGFLSIFESVKFNVTVADSNVNTAVSEQTSKYSLDVRVHAGVDPMPSGMAKVLNILEGVIQQQIATTTTN